MHVVFVCVFVCLMRKEDGGKRLKVNVKLISPSRLLLACSEAASLEMKGLDNISCHSKSWTKAKTVLIARHLWVNLHARVQLDFHLLLLVEADAR